ncbi:MAG: ABC transporter substrate-binding protein, partial [Rhizobiales bacterium]|nr:ABC transporter substrate-binding protein [Hyphomicrobiales bacterium]
MADIAMIARCILTLVAAGLGATAALAENKPRVASINVCTDQLVLALAEPAQIVGLSPYSRDADRSYSADQARRYRRLSGEAEDVLILRPDIVLSSDFTRRATRELLQAKGFRI